MTKGLVRYQQTGDFHFITFSCYQRQPFLTFPDTCALFERSLERTRLRYNFCIAGYVVMPEHVHLLVNEPEEAPLATIMQALKLSVSVRSQRPFWLATYYDLNVHTAFEHTGRSSATSIAIP